jgi:hypothetical protein
VSKKGQSPPPTGKIGDEVEVLFEDKVWLDGIVTSVLSDGIAVMTIAGPLTKKNPDEVRLRSR